MARARSAATDTDSLDWSHAPVRDPQPCVLCGRPALLRHPKALRPCHKTCSDAKAAAGIERASAAYTGAAS
jgi:hypothetical protein